jgi:hypothetical protein
MSGIFFSSALRQAFRRLLSAPIFTIVIFVTLHFARLRHFAHDLARRKAGLLLIAVRFVKGIRSG